jgi:hypothetical protein
MEAPIRTLQDAFDRGILSHGDLPHHLKQSVSLRDFTAALQAHCIDRCLSYDHLPRLIRDVIDRPSYARRLLQTSRENLRLYPYSIIDDAVVYGGETPLDYYSSVLALMLNREWAYDALPNFTAVDVLRLFGLGRNEYIATLNRLKSKTARWLLKASYVNDLIPRRLAESCALHPAWIVHSTPMPSDRAEERIEQYLQNHKPSSKGNNSNASLSGTASSLPNADASGSASTFEPSSSASGAFAPKSKKDIAARTKKLMDVYSLLRQSDRAAEHRARYPHSKPRHHHDPHKPAANQHSAEAKDNPLEGDGPTVTKPAKRDHEGLPYRACEFPRDDINTLYRLGLVYPVIEVHADDSLSVPPFEGFVMNRSTQDWQERLLYETLSSLDEHRTLSEHARDLVSESGFRSEGDTAAALQGNSLSGISATSADLREPVDAEAELAVTIREATMSQTMTVHPPVSLDAVRRNSGSAVARLLAGRVTAEREAMLVRLIWATCVLSYLNLVKVHTPATRFRHEGGGDGPDGSSSRPTVVISVLGGSEAQRAGFVPATPLLSKAFMPGLRSAASPHSYSIAGSATTLPATSMDDSAVAGSHPSDDTNADGGGHVTFSPDHPAPAEAVKSTTTFPVDPSWKEFVDELSTMAPSLPNAAPIADGARLEHGDLAHLADAAGDDIQAGKDRRLCLLYDGAMAGRLMMAAHGPEHRRLKRAAVTLFEAGKLSHRFVEELVPLLEPIHALFLAHHSLPRSAVDPNLLTLEPRSPTRDVDIVHQHEHPTGSVPLPLDEPSWVGLLADAAAVGDDDGGVTAAGPADSLAPGNPAIRLPTSEASTILCVVSNSVSTFEIHTAAHRRRGRR